MLNGNNINHDKDFTAGLLAMLNPWVIEGLAVSGSGASANITAWKALIECTRSNGEKVMVFFENTANVSVDLTGTKKVYILVDQGKLDDGSSNAEDGTGVASIQTGASWPSWSYIKVASTVSGTITDERIFLTEKNLLRKGFWSWNIVDFVWGDEVLKTISASWVLSLTDLFRIKNNDGSWKEVLYSVLKNDLLSAGQYTQEKTMGEALASAGYSSNIVNAFSTSWSNAGTYTVMWGRLQFGQRTKIVSAKYPHNASNGSASIVITMGESPFTVLWTYPVANGTKEATGINFVCEPWVIYQIGCNSTANFGNLHANYTLTSTDIANGFISGCYGNANFDATWRMQEVVTQKENPAIYAIAVVNAIKYINAFTASWWANKTRIGNRVSFPWDVKIKKVKTWQTTSSSSASILVLDASWNTLKTVPMTTGTNEVDIDFTCTANTEYRIVCNDTANWTSWSTYWYTPVATYKNNFPYALWSVYGAGAGTLDNANCVIFTDINLDFQGKAYKAKGGNSFEFAFNKFAGFVAGPKSAWDTVTLNATEYNITDGFSGLNKWSQYFLSTVGGIITSSPTTSNAYRVWFAVSSTAINILTWYNGTDSTYIAIGSISNWSSPATQSRHAFEVREKWVLQFVTSAGVPNWNLGYWILQNLYKNDVLIASNISNGGTTSTNVVEWDIIIVEATASCLGWYSWSLGAGTITINIQKTLTKPLSITL